MHDEMYLSDAERKEAEVQQHEPHRFGEFRLPDNSHIKFGNLRADGTFPNVLSYASKVSPPASHK